MNPLFAAAADVQAFCAARGWKSAVIGGVAVQRWGEPRLTRDVDVTIFAGLGGEDRFVDALLAAYRGRLAQARQFALITECCSSRQRVASRSMCPLPAFRSRNA
jgi:hypothetical protein